MRLHGVRLVAVALAFLAGPALAVGPAAVRPDRALGLEPLDTPRAFDRASRLEILSFVAALTETGGLDAAALTRVLGIKTANLESVRTWRRVTGERLAENFRHASGTCATGEWLCDPKMTVAALDRAAAGLDAAVPERFRAWRENARAFHR